ncbi:MAG: hypothetical protein E7310_03225 [Clostridiales bacterium]|nr:hypothetical protein [Clostridiales bacterium]
MRKISINMMKIVVMLIIGIFAIGMSLGVNATVLRISVKGDLEYELNEEIDTSKFKVVAIEAEGEEVEVTEEVEFILPKMDELGEHEVIVRYGELEVAFTITVVEVAETLPDAETNKETIVDTEQPKDDGMDDVVNDATNGGFDFLDKVEGVMGFILPLIQSLIEMILPMIQTMIPVATELVSAAVPVIVEVAPPLIQTGVSLITSIATSIIL